MKKMKRMLTTLMLAFLMAFMIVQPSEASSIKLTHKSMSMQIGQTRTLKVKGTKRKVKWSSSKKSVATVSSKGKVRAKKAGKATIYAKVAGRTLKCTVRVKAPELNMENLELPVEKTYQLTLDNADYGTITWSSSDESIVTVDSNGLVTASDQKGEATVTALYKGKNYTCKVNVISYEDVYADLIEKIKNSKQVDDEGNHYIGDRTKITYTKFDSDNLSAIYYLEDQDVFKFVYYNKNGEYEDIDQDGEKEYTLENMTICMYLNILNENTAKINFEYYVGDDYLTSTKAIDVTTYTNDENMDFKDFSYTDGVFEALVEDDDLEDLTEDGKDEIASVICEFGSWAAMESWEELMQDYTGYNFADLGFISMEPLEEEE